MKELETFKDFLISLLTEARELDKRATGIAQAEGREVSAEGK